VRNGCLERREQITLAGYVGRIDAADFDGDGVEDVAVVTSVDARVYFGGTAAAGRPEGLVADDFVVAGQPEFEPWSRVVAGDFDDDGDADIGLSSSQLYDFVAGDSEGGFAPLVNVVLLPSRASIGGMAGGDVDGDGDPEVVLTESGLGTTNVLGSVVAFRDGNSVLGSYTEDGLLFSGLATGDINGDHLEDVAVVRFVPDPVDFRDVRLLRSTGSGFTGFGQSGGLTSLPSRAVDMELRDIDVDGKVDFLASDGGQLSWWHASGTGGFAVRVDRAAGPAPNRLAFGTVGGAPRADLVVGNTSAPFAQVSYLANASRL
jgi:hypothetical protein